MTTNRGRHTPGHNGPQHKEFPVRHVDHAHHAKNQTQANRSQRKNCRLHRAFKQGQDKVWSKFHETLYVLPIKS